MRSSPTSHRVFSRAWGVLLACLMVAAAFSPVVAKSNKGPSEKDLKEAERNLARAQEEAKVLGNQIGTTKGRIQLLRTDVDNLRGEVKLATAEYEEAAEKLAETEEKQGAIEDDFDVVRDVMDDRTRSAYIEGPTGGLEVLLGSESLEDMSERSTFLNALQAQDANASRKLRALAHDLQAVKHEQKLQAKEAEQLLKYKEQEQEALQAKVDEQNAALDDLSKQLHQAQMLEKKWGVRVETIAKKLAVYPVNGNGPLYVCPVPNYTWLSDDWLAPRVGHLHQGNDIGAANGADIVAPFDGVAKSTNSSLGGLSVYVYGKDGYVYNAHLSRLGKQGHVEAGDVVGYVGTSGNAASTAPHDHFEWHPNDGNAVDPHEYLMEVCHK